MIRNFISEKWREICVVAGLCVFVFTASGLSGDVSGSVEDGEGSVDGSIYYTESDRLVMTLSAGIVAMGLVTRRRN